MEKFKVSFEANNQQLKSIGTKHASDTYADIEATFVLGEKWTDMDSVSAVWWNDFTRIATVLDSQGKCIVPHEVLTRKGCVRVNLVGSIVEGDELITRLTSYSAEAVQVNEKIKLTGSETSEITPSQYEQFVANVKADADRAEAGATASANSADEAEASAQNASESASASAVSASDSARSATASAESAQNASEIAVEVEVMKNEVELAKDKVLGMRATAETLEAGSDATASYSDGLLTLGIPRGDRGEQGIQGETGATPNLTIGTVETLEPTEDATASITGTAENPVLNLGLPKGDTGEVSLEDLEALLPTETASGSIVTIADGQSVVPAKSLKVALEPIQDLNGYDKPWSGGAGKNKIPPKTGQAGTAQLILGDDATAIASASGVYLKSGTYTLSVNSTKTSTIYWYDVSSGANEGIGNTLAPRTVTVSTDGYYFPFLYNSSGISSSDVTTFQLELGSTATSYEPYSNICPISGHTECVTEVSGVNVWNEEWEVGEINSSTGEDALNSSIWRSKNYIPIIPNTSYYAKSRTANSKSIRARFYDADKNYIGYSPQGGGQVFTDTVFVTPANAYYMRIAPNNSDIPNHDISINYPSTDHEYHAYAGHTYTTSLGRTVYGGVLDVVSGELVVDRAMVDLGTLTWSRVSGVNSAFRTYISDMYQSKANDYADILCSQYPYNSIKGHTSQSNVLAVISDGTYMVVYDATYLYIRNDSYSDATDFKTAMDGVQLVYELATPQTIQLTPQEVQLLLGTNNIWSDGNVTLVYSADIQRYIEKKLNGNSTTLTMSRPMTEETE